MDAAMTPSFFRSYSRYLIALFQFSGLGLPFNCVLILLNTLLSGTSLLLLIPLLQLGSKSLSTQGSSSFFSLLGTQWPLVGILALFVGLIVASAAFDFFQTLSLSKLRHRFVSTLQRELIRWIAKSNWNVITSENHSDCQHMLSVGIGQLSQLTQQSLQLIADSIWVLALLCLSMLITFKLTLLTTIVALVFLASTHTQKAALSGRHGFRTSQKIQETATRFFEGLKLAQSYNKLPSYFDQFDAYILENQTIQLYFQRVQITLQSIFKAGSALIFALIFWIAHDVFLLSIPTLITLLILFSRLFPKVSSLQQTVLRIQNTLPIFDHFLEIKNRYLNTKNASNTGQTPVIFQHTITFRNVQYCYEKSSDTPLLKDVSFELNKGEWVALIGESGIGKSTLTNMLLGFLAPDSGMITIDQTPLSECDLDLWRTQVSYVPQEEFFFFGTVRENLLWALPAPVPDDHLWEVLSRVGAQKFVHRLPYQLDTPIGNKGTHLSGGQRQLLALARALLRKPSVLVLDEATHALDTEKEHLFFTQLRRYFPEITVLLISHRSSTLTYADKCVTIKEGKPLQP